MKNDVAIDGATLTEDIVHVNETRINYRSKSDDIRKLGHNPLYSPGMPSVRTITRSASKAPLYLYPRFPVFIPTTCIFRRSTSNGYVKVCDIDPNQEENQFNEFHKKAPSLPAKAPHANFLGTETFPGGVMTPLNASYAAKLIPTYGATPIAVATKPRYSPRTPPSSRMTFKVIPHMVSSGDGIAIDRDDGLDKDDVWYPDANVCVTEETAEDGLGGCLSGNAVGRDAVAIDRRDRTRSNGYVEPLCL